MAGVRDWIDSELRILERTKRETVPGGIQFTIEFEDVGTYSATIAGQLTRDMLKGWAASVRSEYFARKESQRAAPSGAAPAPETANGPEDGGSANRGGSVSPVAALISNGEVSLSALLDAQRSHIRERLGALSDALGKLDGEREEILSKMETAELDLIVVEDALQNARQIYEAHSRDISRTAVDEGREGGGGVCEPSVDGLLPGGNYGVEEGGSSLEGSEL